LAGGTAWLKLF